MIRSLLGHTKLESAVQYLGIEVDYAPEMVKQTAVCYVLLEEAVFKGHYSAKKTLGSKHCH